MASHVYQIWLALVQAFTRRRHVQAVMRMRSGDPGNLWVPVFDGAADGKPSEVYWPVGVAGRELVCIICSGAAQHPRVLITTMLFSIRSWCSRWS